MRITSCSGGGKRGIRFIPQEKATDPRGPCRLPGLYVSLPPPATYLLCQDYVDGHVAAQFHSPDLPLADQEAKVACGQPAELSHLS